MTQFILVLEDSAYPGAHPDRGRRKVWKRRMMAIVETVRKVIAEAQRRLDGESGQALVEYALLLSLIAIACFGVLQELGLGLSSLYSTIDARFP
jgi:Flp pilus assembly pilin Flp